MAEVVIGKADGIGSMNQTKKTAYDLCGMQVLQINTTFVSPNTAVGLSREPAQGSRV